MAIPTIILTADPDFGDEAIAELQKAMPDATIYDEMAPGVWALSGDTDFFVLAARWQDHPPIFARHICPVMVTMTTSQGSTAIEALKNSFADTDLELIDPDLPFSVQSRVFADVGYKPFDINTSLSEMIKEKSGASLNVRQPVQIISVVVGEKITVFGISLAMHNLSDWAGGVRRFAREKGQISRAEFKLLEALETFKIELPPRGRALDLGAAPGGWTRVLRQHEQYVTAVDPAFLHRSLQADRNVRHLRIEAETHLIQDPDSYDIIVNDMRMDTRDSARLMVAYAKHLYKHGIAIMTFKLPNNKRHQAIDHAFNILRSAYKIAGARQLFHNRSEITVYLRKR
ncbi:MAG: 50S rRNA methyltransferase [Chloroflexi bacterium]|nr:50S rRNA methyltransferase [Chloroflexota bacterium]